MRLNLTGSLDLGIVECFGRIRGGVGVFSTRRLNFGRAVFRVLGARGTLHIGGARGVPGGKGGGTNEPVGSCMLLGLRWSDCEEGLDMDLGCQVGNSEWHLVGLPKDGREVGATGKDVDLGLRGRQALALPAPSHDSRESVGGLPFPPSPCHGHDMAFFLDQNGYCPLSNLNCVGQGGDRRRLFRRGSAFLSKNSHTSLFSQQRRHLRPSPSFLSSTRLAPLPEQHFGHLRPSISKLDSIRTNSLPVPKHHRRFPARSHGSASEQCPRHDCRTSRKELPPPRPGHLQRPALVVRGPTSCPTCASCHGLQTLSEIHRAAHIP